MPNMNTATVAKLPTGYLVTYFRDGQSIGQAVYKTRRNMERNLRAYRSEVVS